MKIIKINVFAIIVIAVILFLAGCGQGGQSGPGKPGGPAVPQEAPVFAVNTIAAVQGQIRDYLALSGDIVAGSSVDVYSDVAGKVSRLRVAVGDRVTRNQAVAEVDPSRPGMDYVASVVRAPIAGTVTSLPAQLGMTVSQAVPLARIAGGSALEIRLYVAERFISKMARGLPCEITLDAWPGEVFRGSVSEVAPVVDPSSRTMEVRVNVDNQGSRLKAGMFAKVRIITERKENIVKIPSSAMIQRFGEDYVFTAEQDAEDPSVLVARKRVIVPGIMVDGVLEVTQGIRPDEDIIIKGHTLLDDGARINIIERAAPLE
jgi:multidrug efflux pump subunit AcrA (membrane-fusion protein)